MNEIYHFSPFHHNLSFVYRREVQGLINLAGSKTLQAVRVSSIFIVNNMPFHHVSMKLSLDNGI